MSRPVEIPAHPEPSGLCGVVLAAGASQRMGTPKALLEFGGETFVARLVRVLSLACDHVIVVLGNHADQIRPFVPNRARVAINPDPSRGQLSSLQVALRELPQEAAGFAFLPVDCPAVAEETVLRLAKLFAQRNPATRLVIPRGLGSQGEVKRGHPVLATRAIAESLLVLPPTGEARTVVHQHVAQTEYADVADPGIFADIDTPDAYQRLLQSMAGARPPAAREAAHPKLSS